MNNSFDHPLRIKYTKKFGHTIEWHPKAKWYLYIADIIKLLPAFCWTSEKLDTIIWNDKKADCLEILLFGMHIGYF
jgi:hypothetical protein